MKFNLTRPLQVAQWFSYIMGVCVVQFLVILPLSALLFHDFYTRLLPPDSSQWVSINNFETSTQDNGMLILSQELERVKSHRPLVSVKPNGLPQAVGLREHTNYRLDLQLEFYCKNLNSTLQNTDIQEISIQLVDQLGNFYYHYRGPIICKSSTMEPEVLDGNKHLKSRNEVLKNEWLNTIHVEDIIDINPDLSQLTIMMGLPDKAIVILPDPASGVLFRRFFENGLRNWMLRRWRTSYILGISAFYVSLSFTFVITCISSFFIFSKIKTKEKKA